ncbi:uncharacterized protein [Onthophagus taurus]|uniref:uncharacterized protein n=1 Tax=Onthophagus taurus TaxID=166361 RepID=UPI0039BDE2D4
MMNKLLKFTSSSEQPVIIYEDDTEDEKEHFHRTYENNQEVLHKCGSKCTLQRINEETDESKHQTSTSSFTRKQRPFGDSLKVKMNELVLKMSKLDVEESLVWDEYVVLQNEIDKIETVLESFLQYIEAVELENKTRVRMCNQLRSVFEMENFANLSPDMYHVLDKLSNNVAEKNVFDFKEKLANVLDNRLGLGEYYRDYENRKHDFRVACGNFKRLLTTTKLSEKQLSKFSAQYDKISDNFTHCRYVLLKKLPDGVTMGVQIFLEAIKEIRKEIDNSFAAMKDLLHLFNVMGTLEINPDSPSNI